MAGIAQGTHRTAALLSARDASERRLRAAVDAHYDVVWRFVRRMGVRESVAEDAVQQVLMVLARRIDTVDEGAERSFLLGTALRVAADFRKQRGRAPGSDGGGEDDAAEEPSAEPAADEELDRRRARRVLDLILEQLPEELRTVLVMCELEELTMAEAATALGLPAGTVASRLRRAREAFGALAAETRKRFEPAEPVQARQEGEPR